MAALPFHAWLTTSLLLFALHPSASVAREPSSFSAADSPWVPSQNRTLVNGTFAAGFRDSSAVCSPSSPSRVSYVFAVWVAAATIRTVVWSIGCGANLSSLVISPAGELQLNGSSGRHLWPDQPRGVSKETRLELRSTGELVFGDWTSFARPTDTVLTNQLIRGTNLTSANGKYTFVNGTTLVFNGSDGYWTGDNLRKLSPDGVLLKEGSSTTYVMADVNDYPLRRITLDWDGNLRAYSLDNRTRNWKAVWQLVQEPCRIHGTCGANSICYSNGSTLDGITCVCPPGFQWSGDTGCERKLKSLRRSRFLRLDFVTFDVGRGGASPSSSLTLADCQSRCLNNATCGGFSYKFTGRRECVIYGGVLVNGLWSPVEETAMFLRVAASENATTNFTGMGTTMDTVCPVRISLPVPPKESKTTARNLGIIGTAFALELLAGVLSFWAFLRRYSRYRDMARVLGLEFLPAGGPKRFSYAELKVATRDFSDVIGQGGFGVVYKGELPDRRVVAVKRLKVVTGSEADFWAEVTIIARMHHLNLVRLWGFCAERDQRLLVYEYIPNGSLDKYLFSQPEDHKLSESLAEEEEEGDQLEEGEKLEGEAPISPDGEALTMGMGTMAAGGPRRRPVLDWGIRYRIAVGVARAIAYLHEECLEWVLHRDIKPENILLDADFCPKVSDFGLAKLTGGKGEEKERVTRSRAAPRGTQGYMAPEWVLPREPITAKADVYSFGMVLLEMVTGTRGSQFRRASVGSEECYLPEYAFEKVFAERNVEEVLDERILRSYDSREHAAMVERMVKTAMWCLQERPEQRPSMGKVAKMLEGTVEITEPAKPTIFYLQ